MGKTQLEESEANDKRNSSNTKCNSKQIVEKTNERPEWLPEGWNVDFRTRKSGPNMGYGYKCYIGPHGKKLYSKLEVLRYLQIIKGNHCMSKKEEDCNTMLSPSNDVVEKSTIEKPTAEKPTAEKSAAEKSTADKSTDEDLPPGWIKEIKIRKGGNGNKKDVFYTDPVSGYVFRSKKDALRYLESGDISSCAIKPNKRQIQDEDKLSPTLEGKKQKQKQSATKRQLFVGKEISDNGSLELPDSNRSGKRRGVKVSSGMIGAPVPTGESVGQIQLLKNGVANPPKMQKTSDPDDVQEKNHVVNVMENSGKKNHSNPSLSKKKELAHRSSRRLAGVEPDQLTNNLTNEQTLPVPKRNLRKGRTVLDGDVASKSSQQLNGVPETGKAEDNKPENPHTSQGLASEARVLKVDKLLASEIGKSGAICSNSSKSSNKKERQIPSRSSKRLAGFEAELTSNSLSHERAPEYKSKKSKSEVNADLHHSAVELVEPVSINRESSNKRRKSLKIPPISNDQLEKHKNEDMNDEKSEPQQSFAFHYSWSDPSLEFAIKTLTGTLPVEDSVGNGPTVISKTDKFPENSLPENVTGSSKDKKSKVNSSKSKNKKELKTPTRLSKRLAGHEPDVLPAERALEYSTRKSCKDKPNANAILTNGEPVHLHDEESKLIVHASDGLKINGCGESSNGEKSCDVQTVPNEKLQRLEAEIINDERSDPRFPLQFGDSWSDPCLEFAIKTLTGSLPDADVNLPVITPDINAPPPPNKELLENMVQKSNEAAYDNSNHCQTKEELNTVSTPDKELLENVVQKSYEAAHDDSNHCQTKEELNTVCTPNKELLENMVQKSYEAGHDNSNTVCTPNKELLENMVWKSYEAVHDNSNHCQTREELNTVCTPNKELLENVVQKSYEAAHDNSNHYNTVFQPSKQLLGQPEMRTSSTSCENDPKFATKESCSVEGNITRNVDGGQSLHIEAGNVTQIDINTLFFDEPFMEDEQVLGGESIAEQPQPETETTNQDNSEREFCASFMDSWSDPCLEFAFKTLTGALPVEENIAMQGCFQEPANRHDQRDGSSTLPEIGSSSTSQSERAEKSMPGQQASMGSSLITPEISSSNGFSGADTQKHHSQWNNNFQK